MYLKNKHRKHVIAISFFLIMVCVFSFPGIKKSIIEKTNKTYTYINIKLGDYIYESLLEQILLILKNGELDLSMMEENNDEIEDWILKLERVLLGHSEIKTSAISIEYKREAIKTWQYYWKNKDLLKRLNEGEYKIIIDNIKKISKVRKNEDLDILLIKISNLR